MWLAPEVMQQQPATTASDVFSFGLVLFELLAWRLPWVHMTPFQVCLRWSGARKRQELAIRTRTSTCQALPACAVQCT